MCLQQLSDAGWTHALLLLFVLGKSLAGAGGFRADPLCSLGLEELGDHRLLVVPKLHSRWLSGGVHGLVMRLDVVAPHKVVAALDGARDGAVRAGCRRAQGVSRRTDKLALVARLPGPSWLLERDGAACSQSRVKHVLAYRGTKPAEPTRLLRLFNSVPSPVGLTQDVCPHVLDHL